VAQFSPILAGRLAVASSAGVEKVVDQIRLAVEVSERKRQLTTLDIAVQDIKTLDQAIIEKRETQRLLSSEEGARLVLAAFGALFHTLEGVLVPLNQTSNLLKFKVQLAQLQGMNEIYVHAGFGLSLDLHLARLYSNSASEALLQATLFQQAPRNFGEREQAAGKIFDLEFKPSFRAGKQVVWIAGSKGESMGSIELVARLIEMLKQEIQKRSEQQS
jgi:hypothetical protein